MRAAATLTQNLAVIGYNCNGGNTVRINLAIAASVSLAEELWCFSGSPFAVTPRRVSFIAARRCSEPAYISSIARMRSWLISSDTTESCLYDGWVTMKFRIQAAGVSNLPVDNSCVSVTRKRYKGDNTHLALCA